MICIPVGGSLHETLCYNLVPQNREVAKEDIPLWEKEPALLPLTSPKQRITGYANLYTWPARMVLLEEQEPGGVAFIRFIAGQGFEATSGYIDPMHPHDVNNANGRQSVRFRENRGTWRDFDSLLPGADGQAPLTIEHAIRLVGRKIELLPRSIMALGLRYTPPNANVDFWRMESFAFPEALADDHSIREDIRQLLDIAEDAQKALRQACRTYARNLLSRGEHVPDGKDIGKFVEQMPAIAWYWSTLEAVFHDILYSYTLERDSDDIRCLWLKAVRNALRNAWSQHSTTVLTGDVWAIRALVKAEGAVNSKLTELATEIQKYESYRNAQEETA